MTGSTLNPNAPFFFPASYLATKDFSPEWYQLVQASPAYGQYWTERFECEMEDDAEDPGNLDEIDELGMVMNEDGEWIDFNAALPCKSLGNGCTKYVTSSTDLAMLHEGVHHERRTGPFDPVRVFDKIPKKAASSIRNQGLSRINQPRST